MTWCANKFENIYDPNTIKDYIGYAVRDKQEVEAYIVKLTEHLSTINSMQFKPVVILDREDWLNKVRYYVTVKMQCINAPEKQYFPGGYNKTFTGKERKLAFEYAEQLAKDLGTEIERSGFK